MITRMIIEGELKNISRRQAVEKKTRKLQNHFIICGLGRIGMEVAKDLTSGGIDIVAIDKDPEAVKICDELGINLIQGDATDDDVLLKAGLKNAKGLIAAMALDSTNVFVVLSARQMRPDLDIIARADDKSAEQKLRRAGANTVVLPYLIGAHRLAQAILHPNVIDFIDIATRDMSQEYVIEEVRINPDSDIIGQTLAQLNLSRQIGVIVIGIKRNGEMIFNPSADATLDANDILIVVAKGAQLEELNFLTNEKGT
jgi:voltage-gated potassium channel